MGIATALTYGVTDAPIQIDRHHIDAGQPTATTSDGGQLWVIRHVAAGYQTVHETWATSTGEIGGGTSQQYFDAEVSVLFDAPYQNGRLLAHATLAPDDDAHVLHVTALTILLWSPGHTAPDTPDIHLDFRDDVTRVLRIERASQSDRSSRSAPTADDTRAYEHCVPAVHTFLVALPDSPWRGYGLSHDDVRYEAFRRLRRRT